MIQKKIIPLAANTIPDEHIDELTLWLKKYPRLTKGEETIKFENQFANYQEINFSRLVNSGSSANMLIASSNLYYEKLRNKKIAIPAVSWSTTLSPFIQLGYEPFLIDCDPTNLGINVDHLLEVVKKEDIATIILVHVLGHDSSIQKCKDIADQYNIRLFEDSCEALGSICKGIKLGSWGLASSFSFYFGHHMSTIEGGSVCTNDKKFANLITSLRSHGWSRDIDPEMAAELKNKFQINDFRNLYSFYYPGYNFRATEINAFLGQMQMNLIQNCSQKRFELFKRYKSNLEKYWFQSSDCDFISSFAYGTFVENPEEVWEHLKKNGIESRPLICGSMGRQPYWKEFNNNSYTNLNYSDQVHNFGIYLPINADLTFEDVDYVCSEFSKIAIPYFLKN